MRFAWEELIIICIRNDFTENFREKIHCTNDRRTDNGDDFNRYDYRSSHFRNQFIENINRCVYPF